MALKEGSSQEFCGTQGNVAVEKQVEIFYNVTYYSKRNSYIIKEEKQ